MDRANEILNNLTAITPYVRRQIGRQYRANAYGVGALDSQVEPCLHHQVVSKEEFALSRWLYAQRTGSGLGLVDFFLKGRNVVRARVRVLGLGFRVGGYG